MGKILVLVEKPSVGRELAKVLNCNQSSNGCLMSTSNKKCDYIKNN